MKSNSRKNFLHPRYKLKRSSVALVWFGNTVFSNLLNNVTVSRVANELGRMLGLAKPFHSVRTAVASNAFARLRFDGWQTNISVVESEQIESVATLSVA